MYKLIKKRKKDNDRGFSLVEVLLAVVLLGIIATPLLQMFFSSYAFNQKSKAYLAAADLAQTTMEDISSRVFDSTKTADLGVKQVYGDAGWSGKDEYYPINNPAAKNTYHFKTTLTYVEKKVPTKEYWTYDITYKIDYIDKKGKVHPGVEIVTTTVPNIR